jgi:small subunit ribosomal protein S17
MIGTVTSDRMAKTRVVEIPRKVKHPKYGKFIHRKTVCYVHDEKNESHMGDLVRIEESRPMSRTKRWTMLEVVKKANVIGVAAAQVDSVDESIVKSDSP